MKKMPEKEDCYLLGKTVKTIGYQGELLLRLEDELPSNIEDIEFLFTNINGLLVPIKIEEFSIRNDSEAGFYIENITDEKEAKKWLGVEIFANKKDIKFEYEDDSEFPDIEGYSVVDANMGEIGTASEVIPLPNNPLLLFLYNGKEIYLPFQENLIQRIDNKEQKIYVTCPKGLVEIYLD